jgi:hypothetical protein
VPAGSTFGQTARRFNVETPGGEVVPARVFRPEGDAETGGASSAVDDIADSLGFGRSRPRTRIDRRGTPDIEVGPTAFGSGTSTTTTGGLTDSAGLSGFGGGLGSSSGATTPTDSGSGLGGSSPTGSGSGTSPPSGSPGGPTTGSPTPGSSFGGSGGSVGGGSGSTVPGTSGGSTPPSTPTTPGTPTTPTQTGRVPDADDVDLEDEGDVLLDESDDLFGSGIASGEEIADDIFNADADRFGV